MTQQEFEQLELGEDVVYTTSEYWGKEEGLVVGSKYKVLVKSQSSIKVGKFWIGMSYFSLAVPIKPEFSIFN